MVHIMARNSNANVLVLAGKDLPKPRLPMAPPVQVHRDRREARRGGRRGERDRAVRDGWT